MKFNIHYKNLKLDGDHFRGNLTFNDETLHKYLNDIIIVNRYGSNGLMPFKPEACPQYTGGSSSCVGGSGDNYCGCYNGDDVVDDYPNDEIIYVYCGCNDRDDCYEI